MGALSLSGGFRPNERAGLRIVKFHDATIKVDSSIAKLRQVRILEDLRTACRRLAEARVKRISLSKIRGWLEVVYNGLHVT
jgi:hypothetical protein